MLKVKRESKVKSPFETRIPPMGRKEIEMTKKVLKKLYASEGNYGKKLNS